MWVILSLTCVISECFFGLGISDKMILIGAFWFFENDPYSLVFKSCTSGGLRECLVCPGMGWLGGIYTLNRARVWVWSVMGRVLGRFGAV